MVTLITEQLSFVVGVPKFTPEAEHKLASVFTERFVGQLIVGSSISVTVTIKVQEAELPFPSIAVQITLVAPRLKITP